MIRVLQFGMSDNKGGIETFIFNYYKKIDRNYIQFDFVKNNCDKIAFEDEIRKMGGKIYEFNPCGIKRGIFKNKKQWLSFYMDKKPDVIHINLVALSSMHAIKYAKKAGIKKIIVHAHPSTYNSEKNFFYKIICWFNKFRIHRYTSQLFACSEEAGKWMFGRNYKVIPNAIEVERFKYSEKKGENIRKSLNLTEKDFVISNVGRLSDVKNQEFLIDMFYQLKKTMKNSQLLLLGEGENRDRIISKIKQLDLESSICLLGNVNNVEDYLSASDIFVFPSKSEGFGIVLLEAQANGLKCYATKDHIPKIVNITGNVSFIDLKDGYIEWAKQIIKGNNERKIIDDNVFDKYNIDIQIKNIQKIYEEKL